MDDRRSPAGGTKKRAKPTVGIPSPARQLALRVLADDVRVLMCDPNPQEIPVASQKPVAVREGGGPGVGEEEVEEESEAVIPCSEEMEVRIGQIIEKIERFTEQVAEMLDAGKTMFKNLSAEFEEGLIAIHQEQIDKWQEEIRKLRLLDASNEEASALLHKARYHLLQNVQTDP